MTTTVDTEAKQGMEISAEQFLTQLKALQNEVKELRLFSERQQDSISSLIALSQHHSTVIEQQNALIHSLTVGGGRRYKWQQHGCTQQFTSARSQ